MHWNTVAMGVASIVSSIGAYFMGRNSVEKPAEISGIKIVTEQSKTSILNVCLVVMLVFIVLEIIIASCVCCYSTLRRSLKKKYRTEIVPLRQHVRPVDELV